jgi:hypothetical protein
MRKIPLADVGISELLPPDLRTALMDAENWPKAERLIRIERLTDEAARRGLASERSDTSLADRWAGARGAA